MCHTDSEQVRNSRFGKWQNPYCRKALCENQFLASANDTLTYIRVWSFGKHFGEGRKWAYNMCFSAVHDIPAINPEQNNHKTHFQVLQVWGTIPCSNMEKGASFYCGWMDGTLFMRRRFLANFGDLLTTSYGLLGACTHGNWTIWATHPHVPQKSTTRTKISFSVV